MLWLSWLAMFIITNLAFYSPYIWSCSLRVSIVDLNSSLYKHSSFLLLIKWRCFCFLFQGMMQQFLVLLWKLLTISVSFTTLFTRGALRSFRDVKTRNTVSNCNCTCFWEQKVLQLIETSNDNRFLRLVFTHFYVLARKIERFSLTKNPSEQSACDLHGNYEGKRETDWMTACFIQASSFSRVAFLKREVELKWFEM